MGSPAASAQERLPGLAAQWSITAYSAVAPPTAEPNTSSPTATPVALSPISSTTPATSLPGIFGNSSVMTSRIAPLRIFQSMGLTPAARTATRIWSSPACGSSTSATSSTSGSPYSLN